MWWLPLLTACVPDEPGTRVQSAEPTACLGPPPGADLGPDGELHGIEVIGQITADRPAEAGPELGARCGGEVREFEVTTPRGQVWVVGYGWSEDGLDATPPLDVTPNAPVRLVFRWVTSFGEAAGFALYEEDRLVAGLDVGTWGPALTPADLPPGLRVSQGRVTGSDAQPCGRRVAREVVFDSDETLTLEAIDQAPLRVDGIPSEAWALAAWGWEEPTCEDVAGEFSWAVWRRP